VRSFDARSGRQLRVLHGHTREVSALAWGSRLFTGSRDGTLRAWNPDSGEAVTVLPHRAGA
jgi:WD40 repeat protein